MLKVKDPTEWDRWCRVNNSDFYSRRAVTLAKDWGLLMQDRGVTEPGDPRIEQCLNDADYDGVSAYMVSTARNALFTWWEYGHILR